MALSAGQVSVSSSSSAAALCTVPPGECSVTLTNSGTTAVVFGPGTPTSASGAILPAGGSLTFYGFKGSAGAALKAILITGSTAAAVGFLISTPQ